MFQLSSTQAPILSQLERLQFNFRPQQLAEQNLENFEHNFQQQHTLNKASKNKRKNGNSILIDYEDEQNEKKLCHDTHEVYIFFFNSKFYSI